MLQSDCLVFRMSTGESIPCSAKTVAVEIMGESISELEPDLIHNVTAAVIHYFRTELNRSTVSVGEFTEVLERVLRGLGLNVTDDKDGAKTLGVDQWLEADLRAIGVDSGKGFELLFFVQLKVVMLEMLRESPKQLLFCGLRGCVKQMLGARRWGTRCQMLSDQIVDYLRICLDRYANDRKCALVVR
jgi:hypothetical protein